jgi:hypothetical protein
MSLLTIVQAAALRCHYPVPAVAFSSLDPGIQLFIASAQDTGDEMVERVDWQNLKIQQPVTFAGNGTTTLFPLPANFSALSPSDTFISSAYPTLRMIGPVNEDDLMRLKALPIVLFPPVWRQVLNSIEFFPAPQAAEIISFVYAGSTWINISPGVPRIPVAWGADADFAAFSERAVMLGTVAKWRRAKGLDYSQEFETYEQALAAVAGRESTQRLIPTSNSLVEWDNAFPGTILDNTDQNY